MPGSPRFLRRRLWTVAAGVAGVGMSAAWPDAATSTAARSVRGHDRCTRAPTRATTATARAALDPGDASRARRLFVVPPDSTISLSATTASETDALYTLHVTPRPGERRDRVSGQRQRAVPAVESQHQADAGRRPADSAGVDISWQESATVYHRQAHIDGVDGRNQLRALFTGPRAAGRRPMIDQMIISFGPDRSAPLGGPLMRAARTLPGALARRRRAGVARRTPAGDDDLTIPSWRGGSSRASTLRGAPAAADSRSPFAPVDVLAVTPSLPPTFAAARGSRRRLPVSASSPPPAWPAPPSSTAAGAPEATLSPSAPARARAARRDRGKTPTIVPRLSGASRSCRSAPSAPDRPAARRPRAVRQPVARFLSRSRAWSASACRPSTAGRAATFDSGSGDYFVAQSASLGMQPAGPGRDAVRRGACRRGLHAPLPVRSHRPTAYWQFGVDAGAASSSATSASSASALGYLHPVNGFAEGNSRSPPSTSTPGR